MLRILKGGLFLMHGDFGDFAFLQRVTDVIVYLGTPAPSQLTHSPCPTPSFVLAQVRNIDAIGRCAELAVSSLPFKRLAQVMVELSLFVITIGSYNYKFEDEAKFLLHYYHKKLDLLGEHHLDELYADRGLSVGTS
jgi:hypothetical protein